VEEKVLLIGLGSILVLGISARWLAWRLHLPSILLLLLMGFVVGPVTGFLDPDALLGDLLFPVVSLAVGIILFEGGLSLKIKALREDGFTIARLVSVGAMITWGVGTVGAHFLLGMDWGLALLIGAILIVTGPTVVVPLLLYIRPIGRAGTVAKWEGIVNDPIGAIIAVLVFEALIGGAGGGAGHAFWGLFKALVLSSAIGALGALLLVVFMSRYWLPDLLQEPVTLMMVIGVFVGANVIQTESGLLAVTVMGIVLANQTKVSVKHIIEFKERLRVLLISGLFVLLAARLKPDDLSDIGWGSVAFLALLVLFARPAMVALSTVGSALKWREKAFLAWMAPRGIVAAAVSSVFSLELVRHNYPGAERLMPQVFFIIVGTVIIYGLTAAPFSRRLGISERTPQGVLFVAAHDWVRQIARAFQDEGFHVALVDTNYHNVAAAWREGLEAYNENIVSLQAMENVPLHGVGRLFAMTRNDEANALAALRFTEVFGRREVYQLTPHTDADGKKSTDAPAHLRGRLLFDRSASFDRLEKRFASGARVEVIDVTAEFTWEAFGETYGDRALALALITPGKKLLPFAVENSPALEPGGRIVAVVTPA
jgi:NhaP-type Na+/H+ or K+/H+ antiporter